MLSAALAGSAPTQPAGPLHWAIAVAVVAVAVVALTLPSRMAAIVAFLIFGIVLSMFYAVLGAPDVALAEAAIGAGVTGALFVYAATRAEENHTSAAAAHRLQAGGWLTMVFALATIAVLTIGLARGMSRAADAAEQWLGEAGTQVEDTLALAGVDHPVTGVLLNFRSYDTFLEIAVLMVAVVIVLNLAAPARTSAGSPERAETDSGTILTWYLRLVGPVLVLIAAWVLFAGSSSPGGAFQSGAVISAVLILAALAGYRVLDLGGRAVRWISIAGVGAFLLVALGAFLLSGVWLQLDPAWSGAVIIVLETVLAAVIGASLAVIFFALRPDAAPKTTSARVRARRTEAG